jgi:hypothetical protein
MLYPRVYKHIGKVCALATAILIAPVVMAHAKHGNDDKNNEGDKHVHSVPEGGPGIVLLMTTIGAILLFSARRPSRSKTS